MMPMALLIIGKSNNYILKTMAFITNYNVTHIYQVIPSTRLYMVKEITKAIHSVIDEQVRYCSLLNI